MQKVGKMTLGLTLIVLGSVKLWDILGKHDMTRMVVQYWPAVLVFLGLEYLWANRNPEKKARLHWGAVILTALIVVAALGVTGYTRFWDVVHFDVNRYPNAYSMTLPVEIDHPIDATTKRISIVAIGNVRITGKNTSKITGQGTVKIGAPSEEEAKRAAEKIQVETDQVGDTLAIRVFPANDIPRHIGIMLSLDLSVPSGVDFSIETVSGDISAIGVSGNLKLKSVSGSVDIKDDRPQSLAINAISGDVDAILSPNMKDISISTTSGDVEIGAGEGTGGNVHIRTISGDIHVPSGNMSRTSSPGSNRVSGTFGTAKTNINIETISGDVKIR